MDRSGAQHYTEELYFLIVKFLETGPCKKSLEALKQEIAENKIIPKRLDWEGNEHEQTFEELESRYPHIAPQHLLEICKRIGPILDNEITPCAPGVKTLLGAGRQSLLRNRDAIKKHLRLSEYIVRRNGCSIFSPITCHNHNIVQVLYGQEISGPASRRHIVTPRLYSRTHLLNRTLGHLSAVYCLLFDQTGKFIITGADDMLVKVWSVVDGRLLCTLRGASAEITDIAINIENTLLAAGSLDKLIRVWCLQSAYPVATLSAHTGMITGVNFCPNPFNNNHYLVSTSTDGSVAFWSYTLTTDEVVFQTKPVLYHEKIRPGQAQMICSSYSRGGVFLAAGSADHHVRVYSMAALPPHRVLEMERHTDRVDSILWANKSLKFISGSKDGTAIIWQYKAQAWQTKQLDMSTQLHGTTPKTDFAKSKLRVTMVCWSGDDAFAITGVNNNVIKIWTSNGKLLRELTAHKDVVYCLENHPLDHRILLSAGHDGIVYLWDIHTGEQLFMHQNHMEGQGNGAIFDAKWSPDGTMMAASDSHGHLLIFGLAGYNDKMKLLPKELFFHTDYRPLVRVDQNRVVDEQTQIPPHLMPPPFLVDIDGNPYPPHLQRLVPGREHCTTEQLTPNIIYTAGGVAEVVQFIGESRPILDQRIEELAQSSTNEQLPSGPETAPVSRFLRRGESESGRQTNNSNSQHPDGFSWKKKTLINPVTKGTLEAVRSSLKFLGKLELEEYEIESKREADYLPVMPATFPKKPKKKIHNYRTRATRNGPAEASAVSNTADEDYENVMSDGNSSSISAISDDISSSSDSSSEYSDWVAEHSVNLEPPQRSRRQRKKKPPPPPSPPTTPDMNLASTSSSLPKSALPATTKKPITLPETIQEIPDVFRPSEWLSEVIPKKFPYYPQMGDEVMFFTQGYDLYLKAVTARNVYQLAKTQLRPWGNLELQEPELVKVIGIKYELRPPRLCCLRLAVMKENGRLTGERFTIKYHDIPDVIDFFVLKQTYDTAMTRNWKIGDRFRSMIDDGWWWGSIEGRRPHADSAFLCHRIRWDNGETEDMSPWDMEPIDSSREPDKGGSVPVLPEEIAAILYHPRGDEWPSGDRDTSCRRIMAALEEVMGLSIAEPFIAPVDINVYKSYAFIVEYPIDLSTIKARFENRFYRRLTAAQFDIRYLATNAEKFNEAHSIIVKHARVVTDLCLRICKEEHYIDVPSLYRQLLDTYESSNSDDEAGGPSTSKRERAAANRSLRALRRANHQKPDWKRDCRQLLEVLWSCQDSEPFRGPVDRLEHPNYDKVIDTPMDLGTVREELKGDNYSSPLEFCKDIRMIFSNSRSYNTNKRSKIYVMTVRLSALAEEHMKRIIKDWKASHKQNNKVTGRRRRARRNRSEDDVDISGSNDENSSSMPDMHSSSKRQVPKRTARRNRSQDDNEVSGSNDENSSSMTRVLTTNTRKGSKRPSRKISSQDDSSRAVDEEDSCSAFGEIFNSHKPSSSRTRKINSHFNAGIDENSSSTNSNELPNHSKNPGKYKTRSSNSVKKNINYRNSESNNGHAIPPLRLRINSFRHQNSESISGTDDPSSSSGHRSLRVVKAVSYAENCDDLSNSEEENESQSVNAGGSSSSRLSSTFNHKEESESEDECSQADKRKSSTDNESDDQSESDSTNDSDFIPVRENNFDEDSSNNVNVHSIVLNHGTNGSSYDNNSRHNDRSISEDSDSSKSDELGNVQDKNDTDYVGTDYISEDDSPNPSTSRKRKKSTETDSSDHYRPNRKRSAPTRKSSRSRRPLKKQNYTYDSDSEMERLDDRPTRSTSRKHYRESAESSDDSSDDIPKISISSRGRIRKITPRARAFLLD